MKIVPPSPSPMITRKVVNNVAKFYAELSSERAMKKQIGNEYLNVHLRAGSRGNSIHIGTLRLYEDGKGNLKLALWKLPEITLIELEDEIL